MSSVSYATNDIAPGQADCNRTSCQLDRPLYSTAALRTNNNMSREPPVWHMPVYSERKASRRREEPAPVPALTPAPGLSFLDSTPVLSPDTPSTTSSTSPRARNYLQHAVPAAQKQVPQHSISSTRISRHLHISPKQLASLPPPLTSPTAATAATAAATPPAAATTPTAAAFETPVDSAAAAKTPKVMATHPELPHSSQAGAAHIPQSGNSAPNSDDRLNKDTDHRQSTAGHNKSSAEDPDQGSVDDSLTVDVMKLPKSFHSHSNSFSNLASLRKLSTQSPQMAKVPIMASVWLEDDEDSDGSDDYPSGGPSSRPYKLEAVAGIKNMMRSRQPSAGASTTTADPDSATPRRRSRKSSVSGNKGYFDRLKQSLTGKHSPKLSTNQIQVLLSSSLPAENESAKTTSSPGVAEDQPRRLPGLAATVATPIAQPYHPKHHARSQSMSPESATSKLLNLIGATRTTSSMEENLLGPPLQPRPAAPGLIDRKVQISAPANFVHAEHLDSSDVAVSGPFEKHMRQHMHGVSAGAHETRSSSTSSTSSSGSGSVSGSVSIKPSPDNSSLVSVVSSIYGSSPPSSVNTASPRNNGSSRPYILSRSDTSSVASLNSFNSGMASMGVSKTLTARPSADSLRNSSTSSLSMNTGGSRRRRSMTAMSLETASELGITLDAEAAGVFPAPAFTDVPDDFVPNERRYALLPPKVIRYQQLQQLHQHAQPHHTNMAVSNLDQVHEETWF